MTIKRIHIDKGLIAQNVRRGTDHAVVTVQNRGRSKKARRVEFCCPKCGEVAGVLDQDAKQLSCGARVYIETTAPVILDGDEKIE